MNYQSHIVAVTTSVLTGSLAGDKYLDSTARAEKEQRNICAANCSASGAHSVIFAPTCSYSSLNASRPAGPSGAVFAYIVLASLIDTAPTRKLLADHDSFPSFCT